MEEKMINDESIQKETLEKIKANKDNDLKYRTGLETNINESVQGEKLEYFTE